MNDIIQKLNTLKGVQPSEKLVVEMRKEVLSKAPVFYDLGHNYSKKSIFNLNKLFANKMAVSFATILFVLTGGLSASYASKSSLPGDTLYPVKIASENVVLAIASEDKKAEVEIEQAGKRLEELARISEKPSDINQGEKLKQLVSSFEEKINKAQNGLAKIEDSEKKAKIAKVINVQTEKYTEVLAVANENLTDVVKDDVSEKFASAADSNKKVNLDSLAIRVEVMTDDDKDEIAAIVKEKVEKEALLEEEKVVKTEKIDIDCLECEESEKDCLEEVDEEGNIKCYFEMIFEITENTVETEQNPDLTTDDDTAEEQCSDPISEDTEEIGQCLVSATPTIEEEKEVLINLLDNLNSDPDNSDDETTLDDDSSGENKDEGEVKGETGDNDKEEAVEGDDKVMPVSI